MNVDAEAFFFFFFNVASTLALVIKSMFPLTWSMVDSRIEVMINIGYNRQASQRIIINRLANKKWLFRLHLLIYQELQELL